MPPLQHPHTQHTSSLQLHPHTHHIVTPGFVDGPRRSDCTAGQMDGEAGWWTTSGNIGLPPLARVMGVGRQHNNLMVDGETYECVKGFCYLGDTLDGDGGEHLAATARIRNGWMKFRELSQFLTSRVRSPIGDERLSVCQLCP